MIASAPRLPSSAFAIRACAGILGAAIVGLFTRIMTYPLRHDEEMYLPVGTLLSHGGLYRDFGFNNLPNLPWLLHLLYGATGTDHFMLTGRLMVFAAWLVAMLAMGLTVRRLTESRVAALLAAIVLLCNPVLLGTPGMLVTNNFLPIAFALLGTGCFIAGLDRPAPHAPLLAGAGLLLGLAAGFKLNAVLLLPPFAVTVLLVPRSLPLPARLRSAAVPFGVGVAVGILPVLAYLAQDPAGFLTHVVDYHRGPHIAYWTANPALDGEKVMLLGDKIRLAAGFWFWGATLPIWLAAAACALAAARDNVQPPARALWPTALVTALVVVSALVSFVPTPAFPQYYIAPIVFGMLLVACLFARLPAPRRTRIMPVLLVAALCAILPGVPRLAKTLPALVRTDLWTGNRVHQAGRDIADRILAAGGSPAARLATLAPIYAIEGGLAVYPQLAAGPLVYRVGDLIPVGDRRHYSMVSPTILESLLERAPPAAILVGFEGPLDAAFIAFARRHGYHGTAIPALRDRYGTGILYLPRTARLPASDMSFAAAARRSRPIIPS